MSRLPSLSETEKAFLEDAVAAAERAAGRRLSRPEKNIALNRARGQLNDQRYADKHRAECEQARHMADFTWTKPKPFRR